MRTRRSLPPGPRGPLVDHMLRALAGGVPYVARWRDRYGDLFTLHVPSIGYVVAVTDPELVKQALTGDPEVLEVHARDLLLAAARRSRRARATGGRVAIRNRFVVGFVAVS